MNLAFLSNIISKISPHKQRMFCNVDILVYKISDPSNILVAAPRVPVTYEVVSCEEDLRKYERFKEIKNHGWKLRHYLNNGSQLYLAFVSDDLAGFYLITDFI